MQSSPRTRTQRLQLRTGLAVLRYTSAAMGTATSVLQLELNPAVSILCEPGMSEPQLSRIGQCLVLRISEPTTIVIRSVPTSSAGPTDVNVTLEYLTDVDQPTSAEKLGSDFAVQPASEISQDASVPELIVMGHVSRLGDRRVKAGEWLAGPERPLPIEGFAIGFAEPTESLQLHYFASDVAGNSDPQFSPAGHFVGTRGQARSLREIAFEISGPDSNRFDLSIDAIFLGGLSRNYVGKSLRVAGPAKKEPLIGLRVGIKSTTHKAERDMLNELGKPVEKSASVLIFR